MNAIFKRNMFGEKGTLFPLLSSRVFSLPPLFSFFLSYLGRQIYSRFYITFHSTPDKVESRRNGRCFSQYRDGLLWADFGGWIEALVNVTEHI